VGQREHASLDAVGLAQFIKTPARLTVRDEREERLLLPQILDLDGLSWLRAASRIGQWMAGPVRSTLDDRHLRAALALDQRRGRSGRPTRRKASRAAR